MNSVIVTLVSVNAYGSRHFTQVDSSTAEKDTVPAVGKANKQLVYAVC